VAGGAVFEKKKYKKRIKKFKKSGSFLNKITL
jgi:hypothetical protein